MRILRLKDKKYFVSLLKSLLGKKQVTFSIRPEQMRISTLHIPYIHVNLSSDLYEIDGPIEFTIDMSDVLASIDLLDSETILLDKSFCIVKFSPSMRTPDASISPSQGFSKGPSAVEAARMADILTHMRKQRENTGAPGELPKCPKRVDDTQFRGSSFVDIPFTNPIKSVFKTAATFHTRCFVDKETLQYFLAGSVRFYNDRNHLIHQRTGDYPQEKVIVDAEFLESGCLDFYCINDWLPNALLFAELVSNMLFCFSDEFLSIKMLFSKHKNVFVEIQVPTRTFL